MTINFDDINEVKKTLQKEKNKLLKIQIKIEHLQMIIDAHNKGIYNPDLYSELMKRSKRV